MHSLKIASFLAMTTTLFLCMRLLTNSHLSILCEPNPGSFYLYRMLQISNLTKSYGTNLVLNVSLLQFGNGIHWIKGSNGSGKTTLLKMIAGLLPFYGDITLNNISLKNKPLAYRRQISWSEAEPLFPSFLTGVDVIKLYRNIRNVSQKEADMLIALFDMEDYISQPIGTYSAGMTKKLSLLLSFLGKPSLIVLDEPFITLDANTVTAVCNWIVQTHHDNNTDFLLSSHQDIDPQRLSFPAQLMVQNKTVTAL